MSKIPSDSHRVFWQYICNFQPDRDKMNAMKKLILILSLCLVFANLWAQNIDEKEKKQFKKTKVSSETLMGHTVVEYGKASAIGVKKSTRTFDTDGNVTSVIEYDQSSRPTVRTLLKYNRNGQLIGGIEYKGFDELKDKYKINYDKQGNKTQKQSSNPDNPYLISYEYNEDRLLVKKTKTVNSEIIYKYNYLYKNKLLIQEKYWSDRLNLTKTFVYDSVGNLIKEMNKTDRFDGYSFEYKYDKKGNKTLETKYSVEGLPIEWLEFGYDLNNNIQHIKKYNFEGLLTYQWNYYYDGKANLESVKIQEGGQVVYITKYLYRYFGGEK